MPFKKGEKIPGQGGQKGKARGIVTKDIARDRIIFQINKNKDKILKAQIEAAKGMHVMKEGQIIYTKIPDTKMGEYLLNQLIGKPKESLEIADKRELKVDF